MGLLPALGEAGVPAGRSVVILVDQFEELFRFSGADSFAGHDSGGQLQRREEAAHFVQLLLEIGRNRDSGVHIVITMRSDFIGDCARFPGLPEAVSGSQLLVPGLGREQREEVIRRPIALAGATIESQLVERLLNDVGDDLDQLPVLQHTLLRLGEAADNSAADGGEPSAPRRLTLAEYEAIGGMAGALSRHADEVMRSLPGLERAIELVFRALSEVDRDGRATRRAIPVAQLEAETGIAADDLGRVLDRFRADDCSFLVPSLSAVPALKSETRIDVGHEALLRRWEKISSQPGGDGQAMATGWLAAEEADGRQYRALLSLLDTALHPETVTLPLDQAEARLAWWRAWPRTPAWTERYGGRIGAVERLLDHSMATLKAERAREVSAEKHRQEEEQRRLRLENEAAAERLSAAAARHANRVMRWAMAVSAVLLVVAIAATFYAVQQQGIAEANANLAGVSAGQARASATQARASLDRTIGVSTLVVRQIGQGIDTGTITVAAAKSLMKALDDESEMLSTYDMESEEDQNTNVLFQIGYAEALAASGQRKQALDKADAASQTAGQLLRQHPDGLQELGDASAGHEAIGDADVSQQARLGIAPPLADAITGAAAAVAEYEMALGEIQNVLKLKPKDPATLLQLAVLATKAGDAARDMQDEGSAQAFYNQALAIRQTLSKSQSDSMQVTIQLYRSEGASLASTGQFEAARQAYERTLDDARERAKADPGSLLPLSDIAAAATSIGDVYMQLAGGDAGLDQAAKAYGDALAAAQALHDRDPDNVLFLSDLEVVQTDLGNVGRARKKYADAQSAYKSALEAARSLADADPSSLLWQADVAQGEVDLGDMLHAQNDDAAAAGNYEAAIAVDNALLVSEPDNPDWVLRRCVDQQRDDVAKRASLSLAAAGTGPAAANAPPAATACSSGTSSNPGATNTMDSKASCPLPTGTTIENGDRPTAAGTTPPAQTGSAHAAAANAAPAAAANPTTRSTVCGVTGPTGATNVQSAGGRAPPLATMLAGGLSAHAVTK